MKKRQLGAKKKKGNKNLGKNIQGKYYFKIMKKKRRVARETLLQEMQDEFKL